MRFLHPSQSVQEHHSDVDTASVTERGENPTENGLETLVSDLTPCSVGLPIF